MLSVSSRARDIVKMFKGKAFISYKEPDFSANPAGHSIKNGVSRVRFLRLFAGTDGNRQQRALGDRLSQWSVAPHLERRFG